jgi:trk system potassium uptake protein
MNMRKLNVLARWGLNKSKRSKLIREALHEKIILYINIVVPSLLFITLALAIYEFGFRAFWKNHPSIDLWYKVILNVVLLLVGARLVLELFSIRKTSARIFNLVSFLFALGITEYVLPEKSSIANTESNHFVGLKLLLYAGILLGFITEISRLLQLLYTRKINPGILFVGSFLMLILIGAFLLKLPNVTTAHLSTVDAMFTSTSAVCVTGLIVVDTATHFTGFGHLIILMLIQLGGLGFMTLTGLLAYAVAGESSFKTQLAFTSIMSSRKINNIMHFVYEVVFVTLLFEAIGALAIYFTLDDALFTRKVDKWFFSIFHSVSAFCNAGFSTYTNGLNESVIRFNYLMQLLLSFLIILGGMGFPIVFNLYRYVSIRIENLVRRLLRSPKRVYFPNVIMLNSRLALVVSTALLAAGFVGFLVFEFNYTLTEHRTVFGKAVTSFFGSVTPRTAGFNTVDLTVMSPPMIFIYLLLMWIGASPGSTGGGIKTTTAGVAILNMISVLRGQERTEFFRSEISHQSVRRAFAIIVSSLLIIGLVIFFLSFYDPDKDFIKIAFEAFSAFSTVGLSLGLTPQLSTGSKIVLMITMFIGRVGTITLLVIFIKQSKKLYYRYPKEDIAF